jgi:4-amino-4-deoxy-L-arabinose transferase-like glycosyltransferase
LNQDNSKRSKQNIPSYFNNIWIILAVICTVGFLLRIVWIDYQIPLTADSSGYFWYAIETSITGNFPNSDCGWACTFPNTGWSSFISAFFMIFSFDNYLDYMNLQKYLGVIMSVITIIPMYYLSKVFIEKKYAMIATILFAFNPRIVENSILGVTEPMYIFAIVLMLYTFFQHGKNYPYITLGIIGIISIIRYEGLLLFVPISLLYFYRFKFSKKIILKYFIAVIVFLLIIISWGIMKIDLTGSDGIISHVSAGPNYYSSVIKEKQDPNEAIINFLKTGITNMVKFLGLATLPLLTLLIPLGIYTMISKGKLSNFLILFSIVIVLLIPAFYAYSRNFQEVRYLLVIFPIFCIFSSFFLKKITEKVKYKKSFLIVFIGITIASTIGFIEYKNVDDTNQVEIYEFSKVVYSTVSITNYFSHAEYLDIMRAESSEEFPILRKDLPTSIPVLFTDESIKYDNLEEFIEKNRINGLTHIIVDKGDSRTGIFNDIFVNEEKYTYLTKKFDTFDNGYKNYHAKIFEIDYNEFYKLKGTMDS